MLFIIFITHSINDRVCEYTVIKFIYHMGERKLYTANNPENTTIYDIVHDYMIKHYDLCYNEISQEHLIRLKHKTKWHELNPSSLTIELVKAEIKIRPSILETYLSSHLIEAINPFEEYFKKLQKWDGKDHIADLASYVPTDNNSLFRYHLTKWLVRTIKCAIEPDYFNKNCIVLAQEMQNSGKTTFCRFICPPELKNYSAENIGHDKDGMIQLTKNLIIILDEIDKIDSRAINAYKSFFSKTTINLRLPYAKKNSNLSRTCSFIGSTNLINFLKDDTGNVRWICFEIIGNIDFDYSKNIDIDKVWAQAYHLAYFEKSFNPDLTHDDVIENEIRNEKHRRISIEEELLSEIFEPSHNKEDHLTSTVITNHIKSRYSYANPVIVGKALNKLGYKRTNCPKYGHKGYFIKLKKK